MNRSTRTKLSERGRDRLAAIAAAALRLPLRPPTRRTEPFLAHTRDNICAKICAKRSIMRIVCAWRAYFAESDASENRVEVCSDSWSIFRVCEFSSGASVCATQVLVQSKEAARVTGQMSTRGLKNYAHKRI